MSTAAEHAHVGVKNQPSPSIRVAVVGLGAWGILAHVPALTRHPNVVIVAVADPDGDRLSAATSQYAIACAVNSVDQLLQAADTFDAVVVATPTDTHERIVLAALAHGKHVLCEKPLGFDVDQARSMVDAAEKSAVVARMGFIFRFSPAIQRMKSLLDAEYIGQLVAFQSHTMNAQFIDPATPLHWKMLESRANGGVSVEYGIHAIDLALWLGGPFTRVVAQGTTIVHQRPDRGGTVTDVRVEDSASWLGTYASGASATSATSWSTLPIGGGGVRLYGTHGSLAWQPDISLRVSETLFGVTLSQPEPTVLERHETSQHDALGISSDYNDRLVASFIHDIQSDEQTGATFDDGLRAQSVLEAVRRSMRSGQWEEI